MSTIAGLPAHILLIHFVVVLVPLTAILLILCVLWPAARRRLVWLVVALALVTVVLTPLTINAGGWLADHVDQSPELDTHMAFGEAAIYFSVALVIAAGLIAALHVFQGRGAAIQPVVQVLIAVVVIAVAGANMFQIHRIGESGARAAWGGLLSSSESR